MKEDQNPNAEDPLLDQPQPVSQPAAEELAGEIKPEEHENESSDAVPPEETTLAEQAPEPIVAPQSVTNTEQLNHAPVVAVSDNSDGDSTPVTTSDPRNLLAAFVMLLSLGILGVHQLYLGRKVQGWIRFAIGTVIMLIVFNPLLLIAMMYSQTLFIFPVLLLALVSFIWCVVDFFLIYFKRKDAEGKNLTATDRDKKWVKILFIVTIVVATLCIVFNVMVAGVGIFNYFDSSNNFAPSGYPPIGPNGTMNQSGFSDY